MSSKLFLILTVAGGLIAPAASFAKSENIKSPAGISVRLDETSGCYEISSEKTGLKFAGELGTTPSDVTVNRNSDRIGAYREIKFDWQTNDVSFGGSIRIYDTNSVALFTWTCDTPTKNLPVVFPQFTSIPTALHPFSFKEQCWAPPSFKLETNGTPWLFFDDRDNATLISPANNFLVARMSGDGVHEIASGLNPGVSDLPKGFSHSTLMAFDSGIRATWNDWSAALLNLAGKTMPSNDADFSLRYLGYWTDNGAAYYYNYDTNSGYDGTLEKVVERYRAEKIPIRYLQLDSWWYYKTFREADGEIGKAMNTNLPAGEWNRYGGLVEYKAHPALFPEGLVAFQKKIDLPMITHNRWIDPSSPYHKNYKISGLAAIDPKWWDDIMDYLADNGVRCYEQDWFSEIYFYSRQMQTMPGVGEAFADNMARAARERGLTIQYCMALPRFFLQGSHYSNVTTIRPSADRFCRPRWDSFIYSSQFAKGVGIWPWTDVFMSDETNNLLMSILSGGAVGVGDAMGDENKANLLRVARPDGVLVKPDKPLLALDKIYIDQANGKINPMVAWTRTDHGALRTAYVFAYVRQKGNSKADFLPTTLGFDGQICVLNAHSGKAYFQSAQENVNVAFDADGTAYYEIVPMKSGLAFFGDEGKFVSNGSKRIATLDEASGKLTATIAFAAGENSVRLFGYAKKAPKAVAVSGSVGDLNFDAQSGRFEIDVKPAAAVIQSGNDPVQTAKVTFESD